MVKVELFKTKSPFAFLSTPMFGKPFTVIVKVLPSASVGADNPKALLVDSSLTIIELLSTIGASFSNTVSFAELETVSQA